jgi:hypothetical protein
MSSDAKLGLKNIISRAMLNWVHEIWILNKKESQR